MGVPNLNYIISTTTAKAKRKNQAAGAATATTTATSSASSIATADPLFPPLSKEEAEARYVEALEEQFERQEGGA